MTFTDSTFINYPTNYLSIMSAYSSLFSLYAFMVHRMVSSCNTVFPLFENSLHDAAIPMAQDLTLNRKSLFCLLLHELAYNVNHLSGPSMYYCMPFNLLNTAV